MALKRFGSTLAASLLLAAGIVDPVHAQGSSGIPMARPEQMTQLDTEEIKDAVRQWLLEIPMSDLRQVRVSNRGLRVFRAAADQRLGSIPLESLVTLQLNMKLPMESGGQKRGAEENTQEHNGNLTILFNFAEIWSWLSMVCRDTLPQLHAMDQIRARTVCQRYGPFDSSAQP
ncbi:MAG: hypothetical protein VKP63_07850 [Cyanobacteriota bacterium]|nr:hypothetical protein [Cyanobacteriota bacterium]